MSLKKIFINSIIIFILCSIFHFGYSTFPNFITSVFFPVNESIWEHLKMIFTANVVFCIGTYIFSKDNIFLIKGYLRSMFTIIILLILYLPISNLFGEILIVTMFILFISIFISEIVINKLSFKKHHNIYNIYNIIGTVLILVNFILFTYLTYYPLKNHLFYDYNSKKYGIDILNK